VKKKTFIGIAVTITLLSLTWVLLTPVLLPVNRGGSEVTAPHEGFFAPNFTLETPQAETIKLSELRRQPVLVFLWASWCSVCKATMPGLQAVYEDYAQRGFEILAVNLTFQDTLSTAQAYFQSQGFTYPMLIDEDGSVAALYQIHALPTSVLIGPDGKIIDVVIGSGMREGFLRVELNDILSAKEE